MLRPSALRTAISLLETSWNGGIGIWFIHSRWRSFPLHGMFAGNSFYDISMRPRLCDGFSSSFQLPWITTRTAIDQRPLTFDCVIKVIRNKHPRPALSLTFPKCLYFTLLNLSEFRNHREVFGALWPVFFFFTPIPNVTLQNNAL